MTRPTVLVVGATGQLGSEVVARLSQLGTFRVRALVRAGAKSDFLSLPHVECVTGDLRDPPSLVRACRGVTSVIATATVVFPRGSYSFQRDEEAGYRNLLSASEQMGVSRIVYVSLAIPFQEKYLRASPTYRSKHFVEQLIKASGLEYAIVRCGPFMDDYFSLMGSELPLRGEHAATLNRASGVTRLFRRMFGRSIDNWGVALVPGSVRTRHAFVAIADVARVLVEAVKNVDAPTLVIELGGPEALSWRDVSLLYEKLLGRRVSVVSLPLLLLRILAFTTRPLSEALSNQLAILWILGKEETSELVDLRVRARGTSAWEYLSEKAGARPV